MSEQHVVLRMNDIEKRFSSVYALKGVNLELVRGEVHALLGENGAGKPPQIKVLGGIYQCDNGEIYLNGEKVTIDGVRDAQAKKISIIHQEIVLVPHISVAENIFLGREPRNALGLKDSGLMRRKAQEMVSRLGLDINVDTHVFHLTIAQQQLVEIVKAVSFDAQIIVMDEPTSSLTEYEVEQLFKLIRGLKEQGVSIIYISHKMDELFQISDRITVLRDGTYIDTKNTAETTREELIALMVGRELGDYYARTEHELGDVALEVKGLSRGKAFHDVSFNVRKGEIVGFAGLVGAGRSEVMQAIFGVDPLDSGEIFLDGGQVRIPNVQSAMNHGLALIPEDRKKQGLILMNSVGFNLTLTVLKSFIKGIVVKTSEKKRIIDEYIQALMIKTPSDRQTVNNLSGGNQQKVVLGKWLATKPKVLILDEPTRGVDVGAKAEIYSIIDKMAADGIAVIMISSELPEIIGMCDRVYVMEQGRVSGELPRAEFSQEKIMHYATGGDR